MLLLLDGVLGMESHGHDISSPSSWGILSHFSTTAELLLARVALLLAMIWIISAAEELAVCIGSWVTEWE